MTANRQIKIVGPSSISAAERHGQPPRLRGRLDQLVGIFFLFFSALARAVTPGDLDNRWDGKRLILVLSLYGRPHLVLITGHRSVNHKNKSED
jgi:hypothetical protein